MDNHTIPTSMDNHTIPIPTFTPRTIKRCIAFAADCGDPSQGDIRLLLQGRQGYQNPTENREMDFLKFRRNMPTPAASDTHSGQNQETSGILDLDQLPGLDEYSLTVDSVIPGEMTGRSTGTTDNQLMSHSICSASFPSQQPNLTADEVAFAIDKAFLPVNPNQLNKEIRDPALNDSGDASQLSYVAGYFRDRCDDLGNVLHRSDSPQYDLPGIIRPSEVSNFGSNKQPFDLNLDNVPVRESRLKEKTNQNPGYKLKTPMEFQFQYRPIKGAQMFQSTPRPLKTSNRPTALNDPTKQYLQPTKTYMDSNESEIKSLRISSIRKYIAENSDCAGLLTYTSKNKPLSEVNNLESTMAIQDQVTALKDSKKTETAGSSATSNTVITLEVPKSRFSKPVATADAAQITHNVQSLNTAKSKSPSSRSHSTKISVISPTMNKTVSPISAAISATPISGFVGVKIETIITAVTKTQNWLTATLQCDSHANEEAILLEFCRFPILLSPGKPKNFNIKMTFKKPMKTYLPMTILIKDEASKTEAIEIAPLQVDIKMPIIQALAAAEMNRVIFPPVLEGQIALQALILISDCPADLQLVLTIAEGNSMCFINSLQEIKKEDVNKNIFDVNSKDSSGKRRIKPLNKYLCGLSRGRAIKVIVGFKAHKLADLQMTNNILSFDCSMDVSLIGVATPVVKVDLCALVGTCSLVTNAPNGVLHVVNGSTVLAVSNSGTATGTWLITIEGPHFEVSLDEVEIPPECTLDICVLYTGPDDLLAKGKLKFEEATTHAVETLQLKACPIKSFPIKSNHRSFSWVRPGTKELNLKNYSDDKVAVHCKITGEGFKIHGLRSSCQNMLLSFGPKDIRQIPIVFQPTTNMPCVATVYLTQENNDLSKRVYLYGYNSGEPLRWSALATFGDTALVKAIPRQPVQFTLLNKAETAAFVAASVTFNPHFISLQAGSTLKNGRCIIPGRSSALLELSVDWSRVDRILRGSAAASTTLAMVTVDTGADFTRRRIIKLFKTRSDRGLESSSLPEHLQPLLGPFEGEDTTLDNYLNEFGDDESALNELVSGLQKLTAQIEIQQGVADENTIVINDDTMYEHYTLSD